jgi:hypothetical protein
MLNVIFPDEEFILIHIPKCGGWSIAEGSFKDSRKIGPLAGIPEEYSHLKKIALVRNPYTRFLSGYRMFSFGTDVISPISTIPIPIEFYFTLIEEAPLTFHSNPKSLHILIHTLPQTHKDNHLSFADFVCRYENYETEISDIFRNKIGIKSFVTQHLNKSKRRQPTTLSPYIVNKINSFYSEDFRTLGYEKFTGQIKIDADDKISPQGLDSP